MVFMVYGHTYCTIIKVNTQEVTELRLKTKSKPHTIATPCCLYVIMNGFAAPVPKFNTAWFQVSVAHFACILPKALNNVVVRGMHSCLFCSHYFPLTLAHYKNQHAGT